MSQSRLFTIGGTFATIGALAFLLSGYGYQMGLWGLGFAFRWMLFGGSMMGFVGLVITFLGFIPQRSAMTRKDIVMASLGILLGAASLVSFSYWYQEAQKYPPIHDITTDTDNPPQFDAILPLRADAPNPSEYGGKEIAMKQKEAYPEIGSKQVDAPYGKAFDKALETARSMPWELVDYSKQEGRIEATHTLPWYGFKDDVVIRVDTAAVDTSKSVIDVRSVSRIGRGDLGVNAERIRSYLDKL